MIWITFILREHTYDSEYVYLLQRDVDQPWSRDPLLADKLAVSGGAIWSEECWCFAVPLQYVSSDVPVPHLSLLTSWLEKET